MELKPADEDAGIRVVWDRWETIYALWWVNSVPSEQSLVRRYRLCT